MGRGKLAIKKLETPRERTAKFKLRKDGVVKKAEELSILCDIDVGVILFSPEGVPKVFSTKPIKDIVTKLANSSQPETNDTNKAYPKEAAHNLCSMDELSTMKRNVEENLRRIEERMHLLAPQLEGEKTDPWIQPFPNSDVETSTSRQKLEAIRNPKLKCKEALPADDDEKMEFRYSENFCEIVDGDVLLEKEELPDDKDDNLFLLYQEQERGNDQLNWDCVTR